MDAPASLFSLMSFIYFLPDLQRLRMHAKSRIFGSRFNGIIESD